jgi:hypothetical protein
MSLAFIDNKGLVCEFCSIRVEYLHVLLGFFAPFARNGQITFHQNINKNYHIS